MKYIATKGKVHRGIRTPGSEVAAHGLKPLDYMHNN